MSHEQIVQCRQEAMAHILLAWEPMQGASSYTIQCSCGIDCDCIAQNDSPRITLQKCLYVGELDFFIVDQPFRELGFGVIPYNFERKITKMTPSDSDFIEIDTVLTPYRD